MMLMDFSDQIVEVGLFLFPEIRNTTSYGSNVFHGFYVCQISPAIIFLLVWLSGSDTSCDVASKTLMIRQDSWEGKH